MITEYDSKTTQSSCNIANYCVKYIIYVKNLSNSIKNDILNLKIMKKPEKPDRIRHQRLPLGNRTRKLRLESCRVLSVEF